MTAKLVSIRTRSGDDLKPAPSMRPAQTISQRQAIQRICRKPDSTIWPAVERRLMEAASENASTARCQFPIKSALWVLAAVVSWLISGSIIFVIGKAIYRVLSGAS